MIRKSILAIVGILLLAAAVLFFVQKTDRVQLLYITAGDHWDRAAYYNFKQTYIANASVTLASLDELAPRTLRRYDAVYPDISLSDSPLAPQWREALQQYVRDGGHLFLEQPLWSMFDEDVLGASRIADIQPSETPTFEYPEVNRDIRSLQRVYQLFEENFQNHIGFESMPGFPWGQGIVPSTATPVVNLNGAAVVALNRYGDGTVLSVGNFLPNRYFITGFDLVSGMDENQGFPLLAQSLNAKPKPPGAAFFNKQYIPQEPYFHFAFATANFQLRNEFLDYVAKSNYGYSVRKVMGPYGRPAMAYQNHFEALPAFRDREGIQWAELLRRYRQIPSFSLVRGAFDWGTWTESVVVHLNVGTPEAPQFVGEFPNSFYSSGTHLIGGNRPLQLAKYPDYRSLGDAVEKPYRAYPSMMDVDEDGKADIVAASAEGVIYWSRNLGRDDDAYMMEPVPEGRAAPDAFGQPEPLLRPDAGPLSGGGYTAIAPADMNGDGRTDLVIGTPDGRLLVSVNRGEGSFAAATALSGSDGPIRVDSHAAPAMGDLNADGYVDLIVGDAEGRITVYKGASGAGGGTLRFQDGQTIIRHNAKYAAPAVADLNRDGRPDLIVGSQEGDLHVYGNEGLDRWVSKGSIEGATANQVGNQAIVGGHYSVPHWTDVNGDGLSDLVVGQLEYGMPVALDDPQFPYKAQLAEFLQYARDNHLELYPHLYFHNYVSNEQEKREIELHRQTFATLGIPWEKTGTNQHTWRINHVDRLQTLRNENEAGIWFNFGFKPSFAPTDPQWGYDFIWGLPFFAEGVGSKEFPMLVYTPAPTLRIGGPYSSEDIYRSFVKLDMPIVYFEHVEYHFPNRVNELKMFVEYFDRIRNEHDYNFMTETQTARSFLANLAGSVETGRPWAIYLWDRVKDVLGRGKHLTVMINADDREIPDMAGEYRHATGVVIEPGERYGESPLAVDSDIFLKTGDRLYVGLHKQVKLTVSWEAEPMHIVRANVPIRMEKSAERWVIHLDEAGLQQVKLYSPEPVEFEGSDLHIEHDPQAQTWTVTRYGDKTSIAVIK